MKKNLNVEAEGSELILKNKAGDHVIIPKKYRREVQDMIKDGCDGCIDSLVATLPIMADYAENGTVVPSTDELEPFNATKYTPPPLKTNESAIDNTYVKMPDTSHLEVNVNKESDDDRYRANYKPVESNRTTDSPFIIKSIDNLDEDGVKNVQKTLVDKGYLQASAPKVNYKDKAAIKKIQATLIKKGYDLGDYGENKDGIDGQYGKLTKAAHAKYTSSSEIDGILGPKTKAAFEKYQNDTNTTSSGLNLKASDAKGIQEELQIQNYFSKSLSDYNLDTENITLRDKYNGFTTNAEKTCGVDGCAEYIGDQIEAAVGVKEREKIGAYGDAWTVFENMNASGGDNYYNVFPEQKESGIKNPDEYVRNLTKNLPDIDEANIKIGDYVNLYYGGSDNASKAYKEGGRVFSTHTGMVKMGDDGVKYIEHNVGGTIYKSPVSEFLANNVTNKAGKPVRITSMMSPDYTEEPSINSEKIYESTESVINFNNVNNLKTSFATKEAAQFTQTLINNKKTLMADIPVSGDEMDNLIRASKVIGWKESNYNPNPKDDVTDIGSSIRETFGGREASVGYTQLKDEENLNKTIRKNLGITNESLKDPKQAAIATMYGLSTKYLQIKNNLESGTQFTEDDLAKLAMIAWNEPVDMVIKTANKYKTIDAVVDAYIKDYAKDGEEFPYTLALDGYNKYIK